MKNEKKGKEVRTIQKEKEECTIRMEKKESVQ